MSIEGKDWFIDLIKFVNESDAIPFRLRVWLKGGIDEYLSYEEGTRTTLDGCLGLSGQAGSRRVSTQVTLQFRDDWIIKAYESLAGSERERLTALKKEIERFSYRNYSSPEGLTAIRAALYEAKKFNDLPRSLNQLENIINRAGYAHLFTSNAQWSSVKLTHEK